MEIHVACRCRNASPLAFANLARAAKMRSRLDEAREYAILAERLGAMGEGKDAED